MGHKISKEQIDPGVKDHIMSFVGNKNELETSDKSDMVNAINSLIVDRVDNINNITKLANSIGNPVTASDNVDEVCDKVNGLLSTFKTNMMNSGVMVESTDKFKQLIDKIKGLTEGEGNKGIQYAEGVIDVENIVLGWDKWTTHELTYNIDFEPTILLICISKWGMSSSNKKDCILVICDKFSNSEDNATRFKVPNSTEDSLYCYITNTTSTGCTLNCYSDSSTWDDIGGFSYCAIGVGEEDTTLRDSLASILQDEGVNVTPEDDMASLITKTDEEFNKKNANKGLNIISATELPSTVTEDQIVVITTESVNEFILNPKKPTLSIGQVYIQTDFSTASLPKYEQLITGGTSVTLSIYLSTTVIMTDRGEIKADAYIGKNGKWKSFSTASLIVWNSYFDNYNLSSNNGWVIINKEEYGPNLNVSVSNNQLIINNAGYFNGDVFTKQPIDFTDATTLEIEMPKITANRTPSADYGLSAYVYIADSNTGTFDDINKVEIYRFVGYNTTTLVEPGVITYDVSSMSGLKYLVFELGGNGSTNGTMYINRIELLK